MPVTTGPPPPTGPRRVAPINVTAIRNRLRSLDSRTKYLEKNRTPAPLHVHELANAPALQYAQDGHAPVFDQAEGIFKPSPVMATLLFSMPGALVTGISDPMHARYPCNIVAISADLSTFTGVVDVDLLVNGTVIHSLAIPSSSTGLVSVTSTPLAAYTDLVTVQTTSVGSGNMGLVVHVELSVDVANLAPS